MLSVLKLLEGQLTNVRRNFWDTECNAWEILCFRITINPSPAEFLEFLYY